MTLNVGHIEVVLLHCHFPSHYLRTRIFVKVSEVFVVCEECEFGALQIVFPFAQRIEDCESFFLVDTPLFLSFT